ncbi:MAG: 5'/3'-nucleotidase SurE [Sphingomonadales bacterium]
MAAVLALPSADAFALRILLTNDDGADAPGITALREGLVAAGHDVTVVAPDKDMSGKSGSMTVRGSLAVRKSGEGYYAVSGTPADCVHAGLGLIMTMPPDLVISGTNFGQNASTGLNISGTYGAARAAHSLGGPAIAVSQMFDRAKRENTAAYFGDAAGMIVDLLALLTEDGRPLPSGLLLNVNHPLRHEAEVTGWEITVPAPAAGIRFTYAWETDGTAMTVALESRQVTFPPGSDEAAIEAGAVSISPLDDEFGIDADMRDWLKGRIAAKPATAGVP